MYKKAIFPIFLIFSIVIGSFFIFSTPIAYADSSENIIEYTDTKILSDSSNFGNYAIQDIESLSIEGATVYKVDLEIRKPIMSSNAYSLKFSFLSRNSGSYSYTGDYFYYNCNVNNYFHLNFPFAFRANSSSSSITVSCSNELYGEWALISWYKVDVLLKGDCSIYFGPVAFGGTKDNMTIIPDSSYSQFISKNYTSSDCDFSSFLDMDSNTDFSLNCSNFDLDFSYGVNGFGKYLYNNLLLGNLDFSQTVSDTGWSEWFGFDTALKSGSTTLCSPSFSFFIASESSNCITYGHSSAVIFKSFDFSIYRPVYRTNNTLVFYNYDYLNFFNRINSVKYRLKRKDTYYDIIYNGNLPNSYFVCLYNENTANIIFDEYINLYLTLDNTFSNLNFSHYSNSQTASILKLGFDFNFTYYTSPLVSSNGAFNYNFQKPDYVEARFSLYPFYIPVLELIHNALIWLMFYSLFTSRILAFIHLDEFLGAIFNIFSFSNSSMTILGVNLGNFIWACIAFIIFFKLLQSFMPVVWSQYATVPKSINNDFNRIVLNIKHKDNLKKKKALETVLAQEKAKKTNLKKELTNLNKQSAISKKKKKYNNLYDNLDNLNL